MVEDADAAHRTDSYDEALRKAIARLQEAGVDDAPADARLLLAAATGAGRLAILSDGARPLGDAAERFNALVARRALREPVSRILGRRAFWNAELVVNGAVLDPRADTEAVVETALDLMRARQNEQLRVLDLGVGSGAILIALLQEWPRANGVGVDFSAPALVVTRTNIERAGLGDRAQAMEGDWAEGLVGPFDVIVSNPPYIRSDAIDTLHPEVRDHDPHIALDGGADGLNAYRRILSAAPRLLAPGAVCVVEIGYDQAQEVSALMAAAGLADIQTHRDLAGRDRVVAGRWRGAAPEGREVRDRP